MNELILTFVVDPDHLELLCGSDPAVFWAEHAEAIKDIIESDFLPDAMADAVETVLTNQEDAA